MKSDFLKILVVEDEYITANAIRDALTSYGHKVIGIARDAIDAIEILDSNAVDIAILDINIQGTKDGIWLGNKIARDYNIPFIFLTAYGDQASIENAIKTKPAGYLTKPFKKADIHSAISLAIQNTNDSNQLSPKSTGDTLIPDTVYVKGRNGYIKLVFKDILYIKSDLKYVDLHTNDKTHSLRYNLHEIAEKLPKNLFLKVHRSYIVNKTKVDSIGPSYLEIKGSKIPISATKKEEILSQFDFL